MPAFASYSPGLALAEVVDERVAPLDLRVELGRVALEDAEARAAEAGSCSSRAWEVRGLDLGEAEAVLPTLRLRARAGRDPSRRCCHSSSFGRVFPVVPMYVLGARGDVAEALLARAPLMRVGQDLPGPSRSGRCTSGFASHASRPAALMHSRVVLAGSRALTAGAVRRTRAPAIWIWEVHRAASSARGRSKSSWTSVPERLHLCDRKLSNGRC